MFSQQHSRLTREAILLAVVSAAFPATGYCVAAGHADFVSGNVVAVAADGSQRPLQKGSEINAGEAINTAAGARAQIRFTDGGYISLQPNTLFRVDEYQYEGKTDGKEKGFFSLLKGGLRAITGAVGHVNRGNYKVATPAATIGIRGTGYNAMLAEGLSISVTDGIISLTNKGGSLIITQGQSAFVADMNTVPRLTFEKPATSPAPMSSGTSAPPPKEDQYKSGDCVGTSCGGPVNSGLTVLTGVAAAVSGTTFGNTILDKDYPGIVVFDSSGSQVYYIQGSSPAGAVSSFTSATLAKGISGTDTVDNTYAHTGLSIPASGYDGIVGWGRFYGTITYTEPGLSTVTHTLTPDQGIHSVVGIPTAVMPTGTAHYALTGATAPTLLSGVVAPGTVSGGGLDVNFGTSNLSGTLNLAIGNHSYGLAFSGTYTGNAVGNNNITTTATSADGCGGGGCTADTKGFFAGANAARAGVAYMIDNTILGSTIHGAAVYTKTANPAVGCLGC
ncbi:MAG TPA: FecR family protein [Sulfuricella sp.]|nr:FecR family protein [Sulfuricella sp.]